MLWHWLNNIEIFLLLFMGSFSQHSIEGLWKILNTGGSFPWKIFLLYQTSIPRVPIYSCTSVVDCSHDSLCMRIPFWHGKHYFLSIYVGQGGNNGRGKCEPTAKHTKGENNTIKKTRGFQRIFNVGLHVSSVSTKALVFFSDFLFVVLMYCLSINLQFTFSETKKSEK